MAGGYLTLSVKNSLEIFTASTKVVRRMKFFSWFSFLNRLSDSAPSFEAMVKSTNRSVRTGRLRRQCDSQGDSGDAKVMVMTVYE